MTKFGFFSAVQKDGEERLTIRARAREDLERLRAAHLPNMGEIIEGVGTDYKYRAHASHEEFARAMRDAVQDIDYSNFKNAVKKEMGAERANVYANVWSVLRKIEKG